MNSAGLFALVAVLVAATAFGLWRKRTDGKFSAAKRADQAGEQARAVASLDAGDLGVSLGSSATLVQFTSAFCQPCRATKRTLERVSGMVDGVTYAEIDAESQLDLTRKFNVLRTPTVFILDSAGAVAHRASGQPRFVDVVAALGAVLPAGVALPTSEAAVPADSVQRPWGDPDSGRAQAAS